MPGGTASKGAEKVQEARSDKQDGASAVEVPGRPGGGQERRTDSGHHFVLSKFDEEHEHVRGAGDGGPRCIESRTAQISGNAETVTEGSLCFHKTAELHMA